MTGNVKVGLFGIGLDTYWPQFKGLKDKLVGYQQEIHEKIASREVDVVDAGLVDSLEKAYTASDLFKRENVNIIFLYISTYALSSTVLPVVQECKVPVVVLNMQPVSRIDYDRFNQLESREQMTGEWLAHCQACSAPEIASVFNRAGIDYHLVSGYMQDEEAWQEIFAWVDAAAVAEGMRRSAIGVMGHYYLGMLDVYSDMTQLAAVFGNHFEIVEIDEVKAFRDQVTADDLKAMIGRFETTFDVSDECPQQEIERAARTSSALHKMVEKHYLSALAYYYEGTPGSEHEDIVTSVIAGNTLLTANHVPVAGEYEIKNVLAMKIMDLLGTGGSFSEFYAMDFDDDIIMLGHDGPAHAAIAEGKVKLVPLNVYHGKPGKGLSIQMSVQHGPVTILSVLQDGAGKVKLLVAEGESEAGPTLHIGNTNSRYRFSIGAKGFMNAWSAAGPSHHCAIGVGHVAKKIEKLGAILGIDVIRVC
ncbi:MAG: L-fucose/L-arabinose isomerase family protein [Anaerolineae bacterium]|jgi:L-arabinose isomerase|nr:L-fucose/L-arabinose isomerase family protein [Anaerolineae bacterium]